jgi:hypothetical protein
MTSVLEVTEHAMTETAARERQASEKALDTQRRLAELESSSAGADSDEGVREFGRQLAELRETVGVWIRRTDSIRSERRRAIIEHRRAKAIGPREQSAELRAQAEELNARALPHLQALREIQGVEFGPKPPALSEALQGAGSGLSPVGWHLYQPTRADVLIDQAGGLERTAAVMERDAEKVPDGGTVEGSTLADLVEAIFQDAGRIGPRIPDVASWIETATVKERRRLAEWHRRHPNAAEEAITLRGANLPHNTEVIAMDGAIGPELEPPAEAPVRYYLVWRGGQIDLSESRAFAVADSSQAESQVAATNAVLT